MRYHATEFLKYYIQHGFNCQAVQLQLIGPFILNFDRYELHILDLIRNAFWLHSRFTLCY